MTKRTTLLLAAFLIATLFFSVSAAQWTGFWAGGNPDLEAQFPGITEIEPGRWTDLPLCWGFGEGTRSWSDAEQEVARAAIAPWAQLDILPNGSGNTLQSQIFEDSQPECQDRPTDIQFIWADSTTIFSEIGDPNGDGKSTNFEGQSSTHIAQRMAPVLPVEPCPDLIEAGFLTRCSVVAFNAELADQFFVDTTPGSDEEFQLITAEFCNGTEDTLVAIESGPADAKVDLYSQISRRFGFALGQQDDVGCDGSIFTFPAEDDRGSVMWPDGGTSSRRNP